MNPEMVMVKNILIIDDEEDLCALLKKALTNEKFTVDCVHNLADAVVKLRGQPDIILLDNNLPDGSGLEFFTHHLRKFKKSFVVFISADSEPDIGVRVSQAGIAAFIRKPFTARLLRETINQVS